MNLKIIISVILGLLSMYFWMTGKHACSFGKWIDGSSDEDIKKVKSSWSKGRHYEQLAMLACILAVPFSLHNAGRDELSYLCALVLLAFFWYQLICYKLQNTQNP